MNERIVYQQNIMIQKGTQEYPVSSLAFANSVYQVKVIHTEGLQQTQLAVFR